MARMIKGKLLKKIPSTRKRYLIRDRLLMTRPNIVSRFAERFPSEKMDVIHKRSKAVLGIGKERLVISLGSFYGYKEDRILHLAAKVYIWPNGFIEATKQRIKIGRGLDKMPPEFLNDAHYLDNHYFLNHNTLHLLEREKITLDQIRDLGIPAVWSKLIKFKSHERDLGFLLVEDLSGGGKSEFFEYAELSSKSVVNSLELRREFMKYRDILKQAGVKVTEEGKHTPSNVVDLDFELSKTFFVVVTPKTKIGRLIVSDVDQISF